MATLHKKDKELQRLVLCLFHESNCHLVLAISQWLVLNLIHLEDLLVIEQFLYQMLSHQQVEYQMIRLSAACKYFRS